MSEQPAEPQQQGVRIDAKFGRASIVIDGTDVADHVTGYSLHHAIADRVPSLVLHTREPDGVMWEGTARVAVGVEQSPGQIVADFLAAVDPKLLDQEALNRSDYGGGEAAAARAMLATLTDWAKGVTV